MLTKIALIAFAATTVLLVTPTAASADVTPRVERCKTGGYAVFVGQQMVVDACIRV